MSQPGQPTLHTPYFRILINRLLRPTPSLRGRSSAGEIVPENQVDLVDGMLPSDVVKMAHEDYWAKYDDLRWGFFREVTHALRNDPEPLSHPDNLLGQLVPLTNLPRLQEDLNTFFIPSLAVPASSPTVKKLKPTKSGTKKKRKQDGVVDKLPDWMATYDSDYSSSDTPTAEKGSKRPRIRTTQLSIHASIHSVPSHLNQYTSIWEMVLGTLELDENWTRRILVGLHGDNGILGHMKPERRVRVADWLGGLVDRGGANALLAMNGLFVLMTQFNLFAFQLLVREPALMLHHRDYPYFYERLYGLLDRNVLHVKYRARFFRLLDTFLTSKYVLISAASNWSLIFH
jgi:U3 small nucleolar RNA-associated protein 19